MEIDVWFAPVIALGSGFIGKLWGQHSMDVRADRDLKRDQCKSDASVLNGFRVWLSEWESTLEKKHQDALYSYMDVDSLKAKSFIESRKHLFAHYRDAVSATEKIKDTLVRKESESAVSMLHVALSSSAGLAEMDVDFIEAAVLERFNFDGSIDDTYLLLYTMKENRPENLSSSDRWKNSKTFLRDVERSMTKAGHKENSTYRKESRNKYIRRPLLRTAEFFGIKV